MKKLGEAKNNKWAAFNSAKKKEDEQKEITASKQFDENADYILVVHPPDKFKGADIAFNSEIFPNIGIDNKILISDSKNNRILLQVEKDSFSDEMKNKPYQLSISKTIADNYELAADISNKGKVKVKIVHDVLEFELDTIEISFKDQFLSRRDLYKMANTMTKEHRCVYTNKVINQDSIKVKVMHSLSKAGTIIHSGVVGPKTKFIFRTLSSRYLILIEISKEMCQNNIIGELYLEKVLKILKALIQRMDSQHTHHKLQFVIYGRLYYP